MHLHHELQRALADTKIDGTTPPFAAGLDEHQHAERTLAANWRVLLHLPPRTTRQDGRASRTLRAGQH
jgi:hypothetical protein